MSKPASKSWSASNCKVSAEMPRTWPRKEKPMPDATSDDLSRIALAYLAALERDAPFEKLTGFFPPACFQGEFPTRLRPNGARRTLQDIRVAAERGAKAV